MKKEEGRRKKEEGRNTQDARPTTYDAILARAQKFVDGLKILVQQNRLSEANILGLLKSSTASSLTVNAGNLSRAEIRADLLLSLSLRSEVRSSESMKLEHPEKFHILYVEDTEGIRTLYKMLIENSLGIPEDNIHTFSNAEEALAYSEKDTNPFPDLILTDNDLSGGSGNLSGVDFIRELRKREGKTKEVPIIMTSTDRPEQLPSDILFLKKPVPADQLAGEIAKILSARKVSSAVSDPERQMPPTSSKTKIRRSIYYLETDPLAQRTTVRIISRSVDFVEGAGLSVFETPEDLVSALKAAKHHPPAIVMLNSRLGASKTPVDVISEIRQVASGKKESNLDSGPKSKEWEKIQFILYTGGGLTRDQSQSLPPQTHYLPKPASGTEILQKILNLLPPEAILRSEVRSENSKASDPESSTTYFFKKSTEAQDEKSVEIVGKGEASMPERVVYGRLAYWKSKGLDELLYDFNPENLSEEIIKFKAWMLFLEQSIQAKYSDPQEQNIRIEILTQIKDLIVGKLQSMKRQNDSLQASESPVTLFYNEILRRRQEPGWNTALLDSIYELALRSIARFTASYTKVLKVSKRLEKKQTEHEFRIAAEYLDATISLYDQQIRQAKEAVTQQELLRNYYEGVLASLNAESASDPLEIEQVELLLKRVGASTEKSKEAEMLSLFKPAFESVRGYLGRLSQEASYEPIWVSIYEKIWVRSTMIIYKNRINNIENPPGSLDRIQIFGEIVLNLRTKLTDFKYAPILMTGLADDTEPLLLVIQDTVNIETFQKLIKKYEGRIKGILATKGNLESHWALIAQGMKNPPAILIVTDPNFLESFNTGAKPGDEAILEIKSGPSGSNASGVYVHPNETTKHWLGSQRVEKKRLASAMAHQADLPIPQGENRFKRNIDLGHTSRSEVRGGVGLTRTEIMSEEIKRTILEMMRTQLKPSDDENVLDFENLESKLFGLMRAQFEVLLSDPQNKDQDVTIRALDIWPDKNPEIVEFVEKHPDIRTDPSKDFRGFYFYTQVRTGKAILKTQIAAMYAAQARVMMHNHSPAPKLKIMFPMVRTVEDEKFIMEEILPLAQRTAKADLLKNISGDENAIARWMNDRTEFGIMIENLEAVQNMQSLIEAYPDTFRFISVGTNDLEEDILTREIQSEVPITRDHPAMSKIAMRLDPPLVQELKKIAFILRDYNRAHPEAPIDLSFCGDIAGKDEFIPFWHYLFLKGMPSAISTASERTPQLKYLARQMKDLLPQTLEGLFDHPSYRTHSGSIQIITDIMRFRRPLLIVLEEWNQRYIREGGELAFQKQHLNILTGVGTLAEFDFLKEVVAVVRDHEKFQYSKPLDPSMDEMSETELLDVLDFLVSKKYLDDSTRKEILEAHRFLSIVAAVYFNLKLTGPLISQNLRELINALFNRGELTQEDENLRVEEFYQKYFQHTWSVFDAVTRIVHGLNKIVFPPEYAYPPSVETPGILNLGIRRRQGIRASRTEGFREADINEIYSIRQSDDKWLQNTPSDILRAFELTTRPGHHLSHELQQQILNARAAFKADLGQKDSSDRAGASRQAFNRLMMSPGNISYADTRLHHFGLLNDIIPMYAHSFTEFVRGDASRFSVGMQSLYSRQMMEGLMDRKELPFQRVSSVFANIRKDANQIKTLRLAAYLGPIIGPLPKSVNAFSKLKAQVTLYLKSMKMDDKILTENFDQLVSDIAWLLHYQKRLTEHDALSKAEMVRTIRDVMGSEKPRKELLDLLYAYAFASRYSHLDPDVRELILREGAVSPLASLDFFHAVSLEHIRTPEKSLEETVNQFDADRTQQEWLDANDPSRVEKIRQMLLLDDHWQDLLEHYLRETSLLNEWKALVRDPRIKASFREDESFDALYLNYVRLFSASYVRGLDDESIMRQLVVFRLLQILKEDGKKAVLSLMTPLKHHERNSYEVIFLSTEKDSQEIPILLGGTLFWLGFNTHVAQLQSAHQDFVLKSFIGFFPDNLEDDLALKKRVQGVVKKTIKPQQKNSLKPLDGLFNDQLPHQIIQILSLGSHREPAVHFLHGKNGNGSRSESVVRVDAQERRGILYAVLRWFYRQGIQVRDVRFDNIQENYPRMEFFIEGGEGQALTLEQESLIEKGLRNILSQEVIEPHKYSKVKIAGRSELRSARSWRDFSRTPDMLIHPDYLPRSVEAVWDQFTRAIKILRASVGLSFPWNYFSLKDREAALDLIVTILPNILFANDAQLGRMHASDWQKLLGSSPIAWSYFNLAGRERLEAEHTGLRRDQGAWLAQDINETYIESDGREVLPPSPLSETERSEVRTDSSEDAGLEEKKQKINAQIEKFKKHAEGQLPLVQEYYERGAIKPSHEELESLELQKLTRSLERKKQRSEVRTPPKDLKEFFQERGRWIFGIKSYPNGPADRQMRSNGFDDRNINLAGLGGYGEFERFVTMMNLHYEGKFPSESPVKDPGDPDQLITFLYDKLDLITLEEKEFLLGSLQFFSDLRKLQEWLGMAPSFQPDGLATLLEALDAEQGISVSLAKKVLGVMAENTGSERQTFQQIYDKASDPAEATLKVDDLQRVLEHLSSLGLVAVSGVQERRFYYLTKNTVEKLRLKVDSDIEEDPAEIKSKQEELIRKTYLAPRQERFYKEYYHRAKRAHRLFNRIYPRLLEITGKLTYAAAPKEKLEDSRFVVRETRSEFLDPLKAIYLRTGNRQAFQKNPELIVTAFRLSAKHQIPLSDDLIEEARNHMARIPLGKESSARREWIEIFRMPVDLSRVVNDMHEIGLIGRMLPAFGEVDSFYVGWSSGHRYSLGGHTLRVMNAVETLRPRLAPSDINAPPAPEEDPFAFFRELLKNIEADSNAGDLLLAHRLGALLHDAAKIDLHHAAHPNHQIYGATVVVPETLKDFGISKKVIEDIQWLVWHHQELNDLRGVWKQNKGAFLSAIRPMIADKTLTLTRLNLLCLLSLGDFLGVKPLPNDGSVTVELDYLKEMYELVKELIGRSADSGKIREISERYRKEESRVVTERYQRLFGQLAKLLNSADNFQDLPGGIKDPLTAELNRIFQISGQAGNVQLLHELYPAVKKNQRRLRELAVELYPLNPVWKNAKGPSDQQEELLERMFLIQYLWTARQNNPDRAEILTSVSQSARGSHSMLGITIGVSSDNPGVLAVLTGVLGAHGYNIQMADIQTSSEGIVLNHFFGHLQQESLETWEINKFRNEVQEDVRAVLNRKKTISNIFSERYRGQGIIRQGNDPSQISFHKMAKATKVEIHTEDRPLVLYLISSVAKEFGFNIQPGSKRARYSAVWTFADGASDTFYMNAIDDKKNPVSLPEPLQKAFKRFLLTLLNRPTIKIDEIQNILSQARLAKIRALYQVEAVTVTYPNIPGVRGIVLESSEMGVVSAALASWISEKKYPESELPWIASLKARDPSIFRDRESWLGTWFMMQERELNNPHIQRSIFIPPSRTVRDPYWVIEYLTEAGRARRLAVLNLRSGNIVARNIVVHPGEKTERRILDRARRVNLQLSFQYEKGKVIQFDLRAIKNRSEVRQVKEAATRAGTLFTAGSNFSEVVHLSQKFGDHPAVFEDAFLRSVKAEVTSFETKAFNFYREVLDLSLTTQAGTPDRGVTILVSRNHFVAAEDQAKAAASVQANQILFSGKQDLDFQRALQAQGIRYFPAGNLEFQVSQDEIIPHILGEESSLAHPINSVLPLSVDQVSESVGQRAAANAILYFMAARAARQLSQKDLAFLNQIAGRSGELSAVEQSRVSEIKAALLGSLNTLGLNAQSLTISGRGFILSSLALERVIASFRSEQRIAQAA